MKSLDKESAENDLNCSEAAYQEARKRFPEGELDVLINRATGPAVKPPKTVSTAVRLVHKPTGVQVTCDDYPTQRQNYVLAAIRLRVACDKHDRQPQAVKSNLLWLASSSLAPLPSDGRGEKN
jgi:protein subunit release factor A